MTMSGRKETAGVSLLYRDESERHAHAAQSDDPMAANAVDLICY
jgi:hypothetical protein